MQGQPEAAAGADRVSAAVPSARGLTPAQEREYRRLSRLRGHHGPKSALSAQETIEILQRYHTHGQTQQTIAKAMELNQGAVSRTLAKYADDTVLAKTVLQANATTMAERFIKKASPKELLQALKRLKTPSGERLLDADRPAAVPATPTVLLGVKLELPDGH